MKYQEVLNYKNHNFNSTTLLINKEHTAQALEMIEVDRANDRVTITEVASGHAGFNEIPSQVGTIKFQCLEASPTNDVMWALVESGESFQVAVTDSNAPNLAASSAKSQILKRPTINRGKEQAIVEWTVSCTYLKTKGGSYRLETA